MERPGLGSIVVAGPSGLSSAATRARGYVARYRIVEQLGEGGMGVVYLARDDALGRNVALKLLSPALSDNVQFRDRFVRESRLAAAIEHPNIIPVYEAGESEGQLFIAMRCVQGPDLRRMLAAEGPVAPARAALVVDQVARALDAAHRANLVHRDIKPGNVMIDRSEGAEHCYLTDFGLTKNIASSSGFTETGQFLGTLSYMAPEQIEGRPLDSRADLYALGCVLFECLAGVVPFRRDSDVAMMYAHLHEPPPSICAARPELPPAVDAVLARALAKAPADRQGTCAEMVGELRIALAGGSLAPFVPSSVSTGPRFSRPSAAEPMPARAAQKPSTPPAPPASRPHGARKAPRPAPAPVQLIPPAQRQAPQPLPDAGSPGYLRAAAIVAVAILLTAGGYAAALLLKKDSGGSSASAADTQAQRRLLERTVQLDREIVKLSKKLERDGGHADSATRARLAADKREADRLLTAVRAQQAGTAAATRSLVNANEKLVTALDGLRRYVSDRRPGTLRVAVDQVGGATHDVNVASTQIGQHAPVGVQTPTVSAASLPMNRVALPGDALATVDAGRGRSVSDVSDVADVNGDGTRDFGIVSYPTDGSGDPSAYVVFGGRDGDVDLSSLGDGGFEIAGASGIAAAGDMNGDGDDDLAVTGLVGDALGAFVVFGQEGSGTIDIGSLGETGRAIELPASGEAQEGPEDDIVLSGMRSAGDFNHDGTDDLIIGDPTADMGNGRAWVVYGSDSTAPVSLDSIGSDGIEIAGGHGGYLGGSVSSAGDVNGDGIDDVVTSAPYSATGGADFGPGAAFVVYGSDDPSDVDVGDLGDGGFVISTSARDAELGGVVAGAGDVNGDEVDDVLVTAPRSSPADRTGAGAAYVVFGSRGGGDDLSIDDLGARGFSIDGAAGVGSAQSQFPGGLGSTGAAAGDVNGDGLADVVLGSPGALGDAAPAYVVYGDGDASPVDLRDAGGRALALDVDTDTRAGLLRVAGN